VTSAWARHDPAGAAQWVETLPPGEAQQWAAANVASNWGRHDSASTATWIERLPEGPARQLAREKFAALTAK
jgi:hypothetical protein